MANSGARARPADASTGGQERRQRDLAFPPQLSPLQSHQAERARHQEFYPCFALGLLTAESH